MFVVLKISVLYAYGNGVGVRWEQRWPSVRTEKVQSISFPCGQCTRHIVVLISHKSIYGCECEPNRKTAQILLRNST